MKFWKKLYNKLKRRLGAKTAPPIFQVLERNKDSALPLEGTRKGVQLGKHGSGLDMNTAWKTLMEQIQQGVKLRPVLSHQNSDKINKAKRRAPSPPIPFSSPSEPQKAVSLSVKGRAPPPPPALSILLLNVGGDGVLGPKEISRGVEVRKREKHSCELDMNTAWKTLMEQIQQGVKLRPVLHQQTPPKAREGYQESLKSFQGMYHLNTDLISAIKKRLDARRKHLCPSDEDEDEDSDHWDD
uniref:WH2 domain-containing protein n=1 Tax=Tetraodon nigroviridis TaxID=99883 RepID=H3CIL6_TETNG